MWEFITRPNPSIFYFSIVNLLIFIFGDPPTYTDTTTSNSFSNIQEVGRRTVELLAGRSFFNEIEDIYLISNYES